jgi:hypothetical protein
MTHQEERQALEMRIARLERELCIVRSEMRANIRGVSVYLAEAISKALECQREEIIAALLAVRQSTLPRGPCKINPLIPTCVYDSAAALWSRKWLTAPLSNGPTPPGIR